MQNMGSPNRLKAEPTTANGGIGVSYSNVVLAGGLNSQDAKSPVSSNYRAAFDQSQKQPLSYSYQKGLEFNAR